MRLKFGKKLRTAIQPKLKNYWFKRKELQRE